MTVPNYSEFQRLTFKDLQTLLVVSEVTAKRNLTDIKKHYDITTVTFSHFKKYYKICAN